MFYKDLDYLVKFVESNTEELGWVQLDKAIREGYTKLDAAAYDLVYCLHRPESSIFESIDPDGEFTRTLDKEKVWEMDISWKT